MSGWCGRESLPQSQWLSSPEYDLRQRGARRLSVVLRARSVESSYRRCTSSLNRPGNRRGSSVPARRSSRPSPGSGRCGVVDLYQRHYPVVAKGEVPNQTSPPLSPPRGPGCLRVWGSGRVPCRKAARYTSVLPPSQHSFVRGKEHGRRFHAIALAGSTEIPGRCLAGFGRSLLAHTQALLLTINSRPTEYQSSPTGQIQVRW
jgi:hypothetical protein